MSAHDNRTRLPYEAPTVTSLDSAEILEALGPAQGLASGVTGGAPGSGGVDGLTDAVAPTSPRHINRR